MLKESIHRVTTEHYVHGS